MIKLVHKRVQNQPISPYCVQWDDRIWNNTFDTGSYLYPPYSLRNTSEDDVRWVGIEVTCSLSIVCLLCVPMRLLHIRCTWRDMSSKFSLFHWEYTGFMSDYSIGGWGVLNAQYRGIEVAMYGRCSGCNVPPCSGCVCIRTAVYHCTWSVQQYEV